MRRLLPVALSLFLTAALLGACSGEPANRLVGSWDARVHHVPGDTTELENASVKVEFAANGLLTWTIRTPEGTRETEGRWRLLAEQADRLRIETSRPEGLGRTRSQELIVFFDGHDYCDLARNANDLLMSLSRI